MADSSEDLPEITVTIKAPSDSKQTITISPSRTVAELKQKVADASGVEVERQRLIYSGKVLKDEEPLTLYKIQNNHSIHLVKGAAKPSSSPSSSSPSSSSSSNPAAAAAAAAATRGVPTHLSAGLQPSTDPLAQLEGVRGHGMGGGTFNPFAEMGMGGNLGDPNAMANMMNNPEMISQMMSQLTPEMIDQIVASNPQLAGMGPQVRSMMSSPFFRQMMSDPAMVRQMMAMGGGGMGGAAPTPFPAPGGGTPSTGTGAADSAAPAANPFAALMGGAGGAGAMNPFGGAGGGGAGGANPFGLDPAMMAQMQAMMGGGGAGGAGAGAGGFGGGGFGGMGGFGGFGAPAAPATPQDTRSLEERFQSQLLQLNEMGLCDAGQNLAALRRTGGNVQAAIELIFSGAVPPGSS